MPLAGGLALVTTVSNVVLFFLSVRAATDHTKADNDLSLCRRPGLAIKHPHRGHERRTRWHRGEARNERHHSHHHRACRSVIGAVL